MSGARVKGGGAWARAAACAAAIMVSLMAYSVLQERIMTRPYVVAEGGARAMWARAGWAAAVGDDVDALKTAAFFRNSLFLVLANRLVAAVVSVVAVVCSSRGRDELRSKAPILEYVTISISNVVATSCQYEALKWLTFPTVTIGKCAKMLPVMLILNLRSGRKYSPHDYAIVAVVLAGCAVMISSGNVAVKRGAGAEEDSAFGFALLAAYLLFDAITSTYQERLFEKYEMSIYNQMFFINLSSATISVVGLLASGGLADSLDFIAAYPRIVPDIAMLSVSAVAGQFAITYTIQSFGALLYAGIMTTRQFFSVLASDILFKHGLTVSQWTGAMMVFSALFYKLWRKAVHNT